MSSSESAPFVVAVDIGGTFTDIALLDSASGRVWRAKTPSPVPFTRAAAGVVDGKVYVFGNGVTLAYEPTDDVR